MGRLTGKVAFITGTAGGQGRAAAQLFAREGAHVIGCDVKSAESQETVDSVRSAGGRMDAVCPVDLGDLAAAQAWIDEGIARAGQIDILYNNAGAVKFEFMSRMTEEVWSYTIRNELDIIYNVVRSVWSLFEAQGHGVIINTASVAAHRGFSNVGMAAHAAAKGGVVALTRQLAHEGAPSRIRVNSISPGIVITPALGAITAEQQEQIERQQPLGRPGRPDDIAYCALYLASDEASWVTGADFVIDGGLSSKQA